MRAIQEDDLVAELGEHLLDRLFVLEVGLAAVRVHLEVLADHEALCILAFSGDGATQKRLRVAHLKFALD